VSNPLDSLRRVDVEATTTSMVVRLSWWQLISLLGMLASAIFAVWIRTQDLGVQIAKLADTFESLTAYLLTRPVPPVPAEPAQQFAELCARCHGEKGQGDGMIAAYIDPAPRDLTKAAFMKTKTRERLLASVRNGVPGTSMAPWGRVLGETGSAALLDYVLDTLSKAGQSKPPTGRDVPEANPVAYSAESVARGEATFLNRCWGCHGKKADGHGPNAEDIVPRPRNLRNTPFVSSVPYPRLHESIKYGVQGTAMPAAGFDFALDDKAIGDLVNYILSLNHLGTDGSKVAAANPQPER